MAKVVTSRRSGWWAARTVREKRLLLAMAALLALVLIWLLVIRPLLDARAAAEQRLNAAVTELARARAEVAALSQQAAGSGGSPVAGPLDAFLMQSAGEQGFTNLQAVASGPGRVAITLPQARPAPFFGWIGQLEARGLKVESLSARPNPDQTIAVQATLRGGAS
ncbi:MAG TPA: type II secretion system protein GspM [Allosphingosinicella sp.]|jgi:general secretion pathway protein M|nr:type II secretion system protein GspM [Allosphingosinicella sp.]